LFISRIEFANGVLDWLLMGLPQLSQFFVILLYWGVGGI
jgi:hypothetical protein